MLTVGPDYLQVPACAEIEDRWDMTHVQTGSCASIQIANRIQCFDDSPFVYYLRPAQEEEVGSRTCQDGRTCQQVLQQQETGCQLA